MTTTYKGRREDLRLLTGKGRYASDYDYPGQLYGAFLRADRPHADIVSIDTADASASPGVVAVITGADARAAGFRGFEQAVRYPGRDGMMIRVPQRNVLDGERVRFVGQEIVLVVAETAAAAQDAVERIRVEYRDLPHVVDAEDALAPGAPQLYPEIAGNLCFDYEYGDAAKTDDAISRVARVVKLSLDSQRLAGNPMEPRACVVAYDAATGIYDVHTCHQGMSILVPAISAVTGVPADRIRLRAQDVGGGFGVRVDVHPEHCALMLASRKTGRPVKWVASRTETMLSDYHGRAAKLSGELALDREGNFIALRVNWVVNMGAYLAGSGALVNTLPPAFHTAGAYRIPHVYGRHRLALTNTSSIVAYRGAGRPNVIYLLERLVDEAARQTGIDRIELRRRNLIPGDAFPYKTATGMSTYDSGDPPGLVKKLLEHTEWNSFEARRAEGSRHGKLRGVGCAVFVEPSGAGRGPREEAAIRFNEDGTARIYCLSGPSGQGHETVFPDVVGTVLGMDPGKITLHASDPDGPALVGDGTIGSRSLMAHGGALTLAAREVVRKGTELAAKDLEAAAADLEFRDGRYRVKGTDLSISMEDLAVKHAAALDSGGHVPYPQSFPGGAHLAEVEIDAETGTLRIVSYTAVGDCGRAINPTLVDGQMHGGIVQGIAQAVGEQCVYDRGTGQMLTATFMDYEMPRADGMPAFRLYDHSVPTPTNALGVKGVGESGTTGAIPAVANAVIDALRPLGIHHLDFPFTAERVWRAIQAAKPR